MHKVIVLLSNLKQDTSKYKAVFEQKKCEVFFTDDHKKIDSSFDLAISLGYDKIIPESTFNLPKFKTIIFHSSDLPKDKGWAPLYHTIINNYSHLTLTALYAAKEVDSGDLIAKAKYPITKFMTIENLREIDHNLTIYLLENLISDIVGNIIPTTQIQSNSNYNKKRNPSDGKIDPTKPLLESYDKIRALPKAYPAYFEIDGIKIEVSFNILNNWQGFDKNEASLEKYFKQI